MQQHAERPQWQQEAPTDAPKVPGERLLIQEQSWFAKLGTAVADTVKDIKAANDAAKRKFDGETALMHAARGALTGAVGAGLELATDDMFSKAWRGEGPIFERFIMGESAGKKLASLSEKNPRLSHFIKEGTQDVALAALYNFIAYRSQPIFPQVESQHVLRSVATDAFEAAFVKSIPSEMKLAAKSIQQKKADPWQGGRRPYAQPQKRYAVGPEGSEQQMNEFFQKHRRPSDRGFSPRSYKRAEQRPIATTPDREGIIANVFNISNPVTQLGVEMVWNGLSTFTKNFSEIRKNRKVKKWSGGKDMTPPKGENVYYGNSYNKYNKKRGYDERLEDS